MSMSGSVSDDVTFFHKCGPISLGFTDNCYANAYSIRRAIPNLFGNAGSMDETFKILSRDNCRCHQNAMWFLCRVHLPLCDEYNNKQIIPCREMCHEYFNACTNDFGIRFDCEYLPLSTGRVPCEYPRVECPLTPHVEHATVESGRGHYQYETLNDTAQYSCNEGYRSEGNKRTVVETSSGFAY